MEEIRKVPPVTRTLIGLVLLISVPTLLQLANPYHYLLWWPAILKKQQIWRLITSFFLTGGGLQMVFDLFMLGRNSFDLEVNHFHRSTADHTWAMIVIGSLIVATNYPLQSTVLFSPFLMAINYLWARANPSAVVSLFGLVSCPAPLIPYAYLGFDLLRGGLPLFVQSSTGLLSAYLYWQLRHGLPSSTPPPRGGYIPTPNWLHQFLPPSVDPSDAAAQAARNAATPGGRGGQVVGFAGGTMFAPRGRSIGDGGAGASGTTTTTTTSTTSSSGRSWSSYLPSFLPGSGSTSTSSGREAGAGAAGNMPNPSAAQVAEQARKRAALLEATERRLKAQRENSIAGKNATATATATGVGGTNVSSTPPSSSSSSSSPKAIQSKLGTDKSSHSTALASPSVSVSASVSASEAPQSTLSSRSANVSSSSSSSSREEEKGKRRALE